MMTYKCSKNARVQKYVRDLQPGTRFMARDVAKELNLTTSDVAWILRLEEIVRQPREIPSDNHWERVEVTA